MQKLCSIVRRALDDYSMIEAGDKIAVGVSGGKDSLALLLALTKIRSYYPKPFELVAVTADAGFDGMDFSPLAALCARLDIPYILHPTNIKPIVFDYRQESNPCSLCARMRRGALHDIAVANGCNKVALGHTRDDVSETFLMSLLYEGRLNTFSPVTYLSRKKLHVIRPLIYTPETQITGVVRKLGLLVIASTCPRSGLWGWDAPAKTPPASAPDTGPALPASLSESAGPNAAAPGAEPGGKPAAKA